MHHHDGNTGARADETATGLDHFALAVADRGDLDDWARWFDSVDVDHSPVTDVTDPIPYSTLVFRDPNNIQLEFVHLPG